MKNCKGNEIMVNEERFKKEIIYACEQSQTGILMMFHNDFEYTVNFYETTKTGNTRNQREKDTDKINMCVRTTISHLAMWSEYLSKIKNNNIDAWHIAKCLSEIKNEENAVMRKRGII